ncbi:protein RALF-like 19 [Impatiens glandulifera]|uniref:protein RALF-like 19 n=1 Tax=Impatiens glandulifera TaxID=253017 RepID=UPI001FB136E0|nr:protein RALF-like 19 [Impatiens glandulifera]
MKLIFPFMLLALALGVVASSVVDDDQPWTEMGTASTMMMEESDGGGGSRMLAAQKPARYISYAALKKNNVPCKKRGQSYYNCNQRTKANPYTRGCSVITHCARFTD